MENTQITLEQLRKQDPERYFQEALELSEFEELKKIVEDSNRVISWIKLIKIGKVDIVNKKVVGIVWTKKLDLRGTVLESLRKIKKIEGNLDCECVSTLKDLGELEEVGGNLDIRGTEIRTLGKLQKVYRKLHCGGLENLEDLGELEEVGRGLYIKGTKIKTLGQLKKIGLNLYCDGLTSLEDLGELEEVGGNLEITDTKIRSLGTLKVVKGNIDCKYLGTLKDLGALENVGLDLDIRGLSLNVQMDVINRIDRGNLIVEGEVYFGGNINGIESLIKQGGIPGYLDMSGLSMKFQMIMLDKVNKRKLKVDELILGDGVEEIFEEFYQEGKLNFDYFKIKVGEDMEKVLKKEIRDLGNWLLLEEYKRVEKEIKEKGDKIMNENKGKDLTKKEKKELREKLKELGRALTEVKDKIEGFGLKIDG